MNLSEEERSENYEKLSGHRNRNTLLSCENEWTCVSCGYNVIKTKHQLSKIHRKKNKFYQSITVC